MLIRRFSTSLVSLARSSKVGSDVKPNIKKPTRQDKIDKSNMIHQSKLYHLDNEFNIFNHNVTKVLDLGYVPGNWLNFAKFRLCETHNLTEAKLNEKCLLLGFDILFSTPPTGTSTIQGNIFSQSAHKSIANHFVNFAVSKSQNDNNETQDPSYFDNEKRDSLITDDIDELTERLDSMDIQSVSDNSKPLDYKPEVILSDLSTPFMQEKGFFNNTNTRPYLRFSNNEVLSQPKINSTKSAIDMADATLILTCDLLKKGGSLVLRMASYDSSDLELALVKQRLSRVFESVKEWNLNDNAQELFLVCRDKKQDHVDKKWVFSRTQ